MPLTETQIRNLKPASTPKKHFDGEGLFLYVTPAGSKLWRMAYRFEGREKLLSFGKYPTVSLRDARARRDEAKSLLDKGADPSAVKKQQKQEREAVTRDTFELFAREWHKVRTAAYSEAYGKAILYRLETYVFPVIGKTPVTRLAPMDILGVVKPLDDKGHHETASRILQIIGQIFRYAIILGKVKQNPVSELRGALKPHKVVHRASVTSPPKVGQLLRDIDRYEGYFPLVCALKLAPLVFTRHTELRAAEWKELDFSKSEWRIPAERMKMRTAHIVPLSRQAVAILEELRLYSGEGKYLFPSIRTDVRPISEVTMLNALRRMGYEKDEMSVHGFRSLASTLLNERGYNRDWIERQLAHSERNGVRAAYNYAEYLPERRCMMQEWADYLDELKNAA